MILDDLTPDPPEDPDPVPDTLRSGDVCAGCSEDCEECELGEEDLDDIEEELDGPYVCPGCHTVGGGPCLPGCIDAEIEAEREHDRNRSEWDYDDEEVNDG